MLKALIGILILAAPAVQADGYGFRTPSANIYCNGSLDGGEISCTIVARSSTPASPRPASCNGNWGHTFNLGRSGPATMVCNNYTLRPSTYSDVAAYGSGGSFAEITCRSETTGLTCTNPQGRGFFLSRRQQRMF
jgi:hypothetical protein